MAGNAAPTFMVPSWLSLSGKALRHPEIGSHVILNPTGLAIKVSIRGVITKWWEL